MSLPPVASVSEDRLAASTLEDRLKVRARALGFSLCGIAPATAADTFPAFQRWLEHGYAGAMDYLHRQGPARQHPQSILALVRSVVMLGWKYAAAQDLPTPPHHGRIARYACGTDYHEVLWQQLDLLADWLNQEVPQSISRGVVDTAPLLERDFARRAGLGWIGKNSMLISKHDGSYFLLAALLTSVELQPDPPHLTEHCGSCTRCLEACPTQAFVAPKVLDATRCISYLTIELKTPIPEPLRSGIGDWLFGCDVCQEVCPWNRKADASIGFPDRPEWAVIDCIDLLSLDENQFRARFRNTPMKRSKRRGLLRNAAIVLGNTGDQHALPALQRAALDADPMIQQAALWAIEQIQRRLTGTKSPSSEFPSSLEDGDTVVDSTADVAKSSASHLS